MAGDYTSTNQVQYKEIPGFVGYRVGSDGTVWSKYRLGADKAQGWRKLKTRTTVFGYVEVHIAKDGKKKCCKVHRLVLMAFVGECPSGMQCLHINGCKTDNRLENLRWGTPAENCQDRIRHGTSPNGSRNARAKISELDVVVIYDRYEAGELVVDIAMSYKLDNSVVSQILRGTYWAYAVPGRVPPLLGKDGRKRGALAREAKRRLNAQGY